MDEDVERPDASLEEPEYDLPGDVGEDRDAAAPDEEADEQHDQPEPGAKDGKRPGQEPRRDRRSNDIPEYRLRQQSERIERLTKQNEELVAQMRRIGVALNPETENRPDPRKAKLVAELHELLGPNLKAALELAARSGDIQGLLDRSANTDKQNDQYWQSTATRTINRLNKHAQEQYGVKELTPLGKRILKDSFVAWLESDDTGERGFRYESQDPDLIKEFWTDYSAVTNAQARRQANAEVLRRGRQPLPRGGSNVPVASAPPKKDNTDPDAVHKRAWQQYQDQETAAASRG